MKLSDKECLVELRFMHAYLDSIYINMSQTLNNCSLGDRGNQINVDYAKYYSLFDRH